MLANMKLTGRCSIRTDVMLASSKSSLQEAEDSIARLEMRLEQYEIHMARGGSSDRVAANELTQARSAYERAKAVRDEIRGVPANGKAASAATLPPETTLPDVSAFGMKRTSSRRHADVRFMRRMACPATCN